MKKFVIFFAVLGLIVLFSCVKDSVENGEGNLQSSQAEDPVQLLVDNQKRYLKSGGFEAFVGDAAGGYLAYSMLGRFGLR